MITILAIGKKHEPWILEGISRYETRLMKPWSIEWKLLAHSSLENDTARKEESERILEKLAADDFVILLDERGKNFDSPTLSRLLEAELDRSRHIVLIIGGAYGVDARIHERANLVWSLSNLVFPHQLVRLILAEQVYRASEIAHGSKYHHL